MSTNVVEIVENTKLGRENALLGNYETSLVYYQGVLGQINKLLSSLAEENRRQKWSQVNYVLLRVVNKFDYIFQVKDEIQQEFDYVKDISRTLASFKVRFWLGH